MPSVVDLTSFPALPRMTPPSGGAVSSVPGRRSNMLGGGVEYVVFNSFGLIRSQPSLDLFWETR